MKELMRWRYIPMHSIGVLIWVMLLTTSCGLANEQPAPDQRQINNIVIFCDSSNLVYQGNTGLAVVPGGCK